MTGKVQKIKDWISKEQDGLMDAQGNFEYPEHQGAYDVLCNLDAYIDSLQEEPVSKDLEAFIKGRVKNIPIVLRSGFHELCRQLIRDGAKWQKENLWKSADGDDLPEIDREVIVLTQPCPLENSEYAVSFAHRPNPDGWDRKSLTTGEVEHYIPKTYGKGGWNIPDIKWWLDVELPKEIEL